MSPLRVSQVGKYQIEEVLGEGAMGVVYRALDPVLNRRVAIKVMSDALAQDADLRERFLREAQAAGSLQHPHVVTIYDFGEVEGHPYIAMEFVDGVDLEQLLRTSVALSVEEKLDLIIGVLQGLAYAHKKGIIHRDIKPANIRVDEEGKARIMDFGIAHLASSNMTRTGVMLGTPNYMAPEQIVGQDVTPRTDIFSVGVVLYELLTNVKPFQGDTLHTVMYKVLSEMPPPLDKVLPGLPPALNGVVMRALQKDAPNRYATALEMANELTNIRAGLGDKPGGTRTLSLRASIETALARERDTRRRIERRSRLWLAGAVAVAVVAAGAAGLTMSRRGKPEAGDRSLAARLPNAASARDTVSTAGAAPQGVGLDSASRGAGAPRAATSQSGGAATATARPAPSAREIALARTVQSTALDVRRRAESAGASSEELHLGDVHNRAAESLIRGGRLTEAADELKAASAAWGEAARAARLRLPSNVTSSTSSSSAVGASASAQRPVVPPPVSAPTVSSAPPPVQPSAPKPVPLAADAPAEIKALVAAYAHAIEQRDVAALRRLYPDMAPAQQTNFQEFFGYVRTLRANLSVSSLEVDGTTAEARLTGAYEYVTNAGRSERQPVNVQATMRRESAGWRFVAIR